LVVSIQKRLFEAAGPREENSKMLESALIVAGLVLIGWLFPEA